MSEPLRIGLMLDSWTAPAWVYEMVRRVKAEGNAQWSLVILNQSPPLRQTLWQRIWAVRRSWLLSLYNRIDRAIYPADPDPFAPTDLRPLLADAPCLEVQPKQTKHSDYFSDQDVAAVERHDLDVAVRLGFRILRGKILATPRAGVWSFHHGDDRTNRGGPAGFWEVMTRQDICGSMLQMLTEDLDNGVVLTKSYSAVDRRSLSLTRKHVYWKTLALLPRQLARLRKLGHTQFRTEVLQQRDPLRFYDRQLFRSPTNVKFFLYMCRLAIWVVISRVLSITRPENKWFLLGNIDSKGEAPSTTIWKFQTIMPPADCFWADPHVVHHAGRYYIFVEEFPYRTKIGHISVIEMDEQGRWQMAYPVLQRPYHLSYPFIFQWQGEWYMIPETIANRTVEVYRCDHFPDRWSLHSVLFKDISAVDSTLIEYQGRWWMFTNIVETRGSSSCDELFLFHADSPLSNEWTPHPCNPIVSDVRCSRPAGGLFVHGGQLYRPAQDCSRRYGYGVRLQRVEELTPTSYRETTVDEIEPLWKADLMAIHSLTCAGKLTVIDALKRRNRISWLGQVTGKQALKKSQTDPAPHPLKLAAIK